MAAAVFADGGSLSCAHQGKAPCSAAGVRLTVGGQGVALKGQETGLDFPDCQNKTTSNPPNPAPCVSDAATAGIATKLTVGGTPVLLASAAGPTHPKTTPAAPGTWTVGLPGQSRLTSA